MLLKNLVLAEDGLQYPQLIPATPPPPRPLSQWEKYDLGLDVLVRLTPLLKQGSTPRRGEGGEGLPYERMLVGNFELHP